MAQNFGIRRFHHRYLPIVPPPAAKCECLDSDCRERPIIKCYFHRQFIGHMKSPAIASIFLLVALVTGCSHGYKAIGNIDGIDKPLMGEADLSNSGGGHFVLHSPENDLVCEGIAAPPDVPAESSGCGDQSGGGVLRCTDGRFMKISWKAISCRAFEGTGIDRDGKVLRFSVRRASF